MGLLEANGAPQKRPWAAELAWTVAQFLAASVGVWMLTPLLLLVLMPGGEGVREREGGDAVGGGSPGSWLLGLAERQLHACWLFARCLSWVVNAAVVCLLVFLPRVAYSFGRIADMQFY
jgi:hypothetical protein